jgi:hypothetical protein
MLIPSCSLSRRTLLRGAGAAAISLPLLEAMQGTGIRRLRAAEPTDSPKRFVAMCATLGFHSPYLFPDHEGRDYQLTPYLKVLSEHREHFTVFSGLSHPEQQGNNGHASEMTWLTGAQRPGLAGFRNSISLDQQIANAIGTKTRFPYLALSTSGRSMSWTASGVELPGISSPSKLFSELFITGTPDEIRRELQSIKRGRSILDTVADRAKELNGKLGQPDQRKVDEYLSSVRELEQRLQQSERWAQREKPKVSVEKPKDIVEKNDAIARQRLLYDMIVLALQTDSTRVITYQLSGMNAVPTIPGVQSDWHNLSHHGKDPAKIEELRIIEEAEFGVFSEFLSKLQAITENGRSLLDHTAILYGSNLGNASAHDWHNLPILLAGGGYRHGAYVAHDAQSNTPLANLFVALAQRMGLEIDHFASSTKSTIRGLET